jgi:hypothetical protein
MTEIEVLGGSLFPVEIYVDTTCEGIPEADELFGE